MEAVEKNGKRKRSYSEMTVNDLELIYGLSLGMKDLFSGIKPIPPSERLAEALAEGKPLIFASEKARSEFIVAPILLFVRSLLNKAVTIYSGFRFDVEPENGLRGVCDFIIGEAPPLPFIQAPLMVVVEAKKNDMEDGIGQCAAEMMAARIFNQQRGHERVVHGCVTTGEKWLFMELEGKTLTLDETRYDISNVEKILGILHHVLST
ncbi:MAG TPA: hypothetical protein PKA34_13185 [Blastocatellia bacterium]|nr:hypothetical protein [Blastocatellia bacterium]HNG29141.1 hypothetical protein [Blastocatellia bacterium]